MNLLPVTSDCIKQPQTYCKVAYGLIGSIAKAVMQFVSNKYAKNVYEIKAAEYIFIKTLKIFIPLGIGLYIAYNLIDLMKSDQPEKPAENANGAFKPSLTSLMDLNIKKLESLPGVSYKTTTYNTNDRPKVRSWSSEIEPTQQIECPDNLYLPEGATVLTIDASKFEDSTLVSNILSQPLEVDHLILLNVTDTMLKDTTGLCHIKSLEIKSQVSEETLMAIHTQHQNIAAFILPENKAPQKLIEARLVKDSSIDNFQKKFAEANDFLKKVADDLARSKSSTITNYWKLYFPKKAFFPCKDGIDFVACTYITELLIFKGSKDLNRRLKDFSDNQPKFFPFLRLLDLTECSELDTACLAYLKSLKIDELILDSCSKLGVEESRRKARLIAILACCSNNGTKKIHLENIKNVFESHEEFAVLTMLQRNLKIGITDQTGTQKTLARGKLQEGGLKVNASANSRNEDLPKA